MDDLTRRRLVHNEELFRAVNEEIDDNRAGGGEVRLYVCECADRACEERIALTALEYETVRADERRFLVAPGHVIPGLEHVVERGATYEVVEKDDA